MDKVVEINFRMANKIRLLSSKLVIPYVICVILYPNVNNVHFVLSKNKLHSIIKYCKFVSKLVN